MPGWLSASPRRSLLLAGAVGAGAGGLLAGPVAAVVVGTYGTLAARAVLRRGLARAVERARRHSLDQLSALAADLRAGVPVLTAAATLTARLPSAEVALTATTVPPVEVALTVGAPPAPDGPPGASGTVNDPGLVPGPAPDTGRPAVAAPDPDRLGRLAQAAIRLADRTGAPLADLLERVEADARATDRGLAGAAAQAAGARATALLLAALPLGGIGLGYGVGVDPVEVLLHTPVGGGCAIAAAVLQSAGLLWTERLGAVPDGSR